MLISHLILALQDINFPNRASDGHRTKVHQDKPKFANFLTNEDLHLEAGGLGRHPHRKATLDEFNRSMIND